MNISTFKKLLPQMLDRNIVLFVWGVQGVGKTQSVRQYAKERDIGFVHLHPATQEPGDLIGLLIDRKDGTVEHARPEWFPTSGEGVIFVDEANRAHPDVIQALFSLPTSRTLHRHRLPDGWKLVFAGNYQTDEFNVTDTSDAAWLSRFVHINLEPTVAEFCLYAESKGAYIVADFAREYPQLLDVSGRKKPQLNLKPDNRSLLEMVFPIESIDMDDDVRFEVVAGIIGNIAAVSYMNFRRSASGQLKLSAILEGDSVQERVKELTKGQDTRFDLLQAPLEELASLLIKEPGLLADAAKLERLVNYLELVPIEMLAQVAKRFSKLVFVNKMNLLNDKRLVGRILTSKAV